MTLRYIYTYDRSGVVMDDDEYLQTVQRFLSALMRIAENNGFADAPPVTRAKVESTSLLPAEVHAPNWRPKR
jgi:hypothetical protein